MRHALPATLALILGITGAAAVGCAPSKASTGDELGIRELERRAVGKAYPYQADSYSAEQEARFASSKKARRELGWHVLAKALAPVAISARAGDSETAPPLRIPTFRTWLGGDELSRMFTKMYLDLGADGRRARRIPSPDAIADVFRWNETSLGPNSEQEYFDRLALVTSQVAVDGLGGNARVAYSPAYVRKYFQDYPTMAGCADQTAFALDAKPRSESNFTNCLSSEFDREAAVIKASWRRNDELITNGLPRVDTTAETLKARVADGVDEGAWPPKGLPLVKAGPDEAYTVRLEQGAGYSLVGLHLMTKELRHWVWVTVWWSASETKDDDFGQDRPAEITALGAPWSNYKMCVVTDYAERDPDPRGGFAGSLGDALAAVHGTATWCSNPFIEKGAHNAQTNCIGCHQHAGDTGALDVVLGDPERFPLAGRTQVRASFPADYSWAFATPASPDQKDRLLDVIVQRMKAHDQDDGPGTTPR